MSEESKPLGGEVLTKPFMVLAGIFGFAVLLILYRYIMGIGAVSNLSDGYPWGIWIAYDVVAGTAIACGGYSLALMVYVFNKGKYHALVKPALLASVFGYTLAGASIMVDIGRYWNAYNLFLPGYINVNSIMFEVAFCVTTYILVLWIEFSPALLEGISKYKSGLPKFVQNWNVEGLRKTLNKWLFVFIAIGVLLPTMHQSSLGSLLLIGGWKVHPLWQTGFLPLLFLISAITMGYAIVIFESLFASVGFKRASETPLLAKVAGVMPWLIGIYLVIRFADVAVRGALGLAFQLNLQSFMFWVENALYVAALVFVAPQASRMKSRPLFLGAFFMLLAGTVYRFDAFLVGFNPGGNWSYFPSFAETMITLGMISFELMAYLYIVKKFPVLPKAEHA
jgi:Ni/Fe-hydrogenase subunit HybB-like protein